MKEYASPKVIVLKDATTTFKVEQSYALQNKSCWGDCGKNCG